MRQTIAINLISGLSLTCLIVFGIQYLIFKNTPVYSNYTIEIVNNPITGEEDIQFAMVGTKNLNCQAKNVYGIAHNDVEDRDVILNQYTKAYVRDIQPGETVTNTWSYARPKDLTAGIYRVTMVGEWTCRFWIFNEETTRTYDNILLIAED